MCRNFFGLTGVNSEASSKGIGTALLLASRDMRTRGYAIFGGVGWACGLRSSVAVQIKGPAECIAGCSGPGGSIERAQDKGVNAAKPVENGRSWLPSAGDR